MTTATIWDEAACDYRPLTEGETRKLQDAFDNGEITVAEQGEAEAAFKAIVGSYVQVRNRIDPEWRAVYVPETDYKNADWDFLGSWISVEWKEYDRCGDKEYFRRDFPLEHLWHPDWESLLTGECDRRIQTENEARKVEEAKRKAAREASERKQLAELLAKYDVPLEYRAQEAGHG